MRFSALASMSGTEIETALAVPEMSTAVSNIVRHDVDSFLEFILLVLFRRGIQALVEFLLAFAKAVASGDSTEDV